jgi:hypothetical protein
MSTKASFIFVPMDENTQRDHLKPMGLHFHFGV